MKDKYKKKVCVVVNSRANYGRIKTVLESVSNHEDLELQLVVGASAMLYRFGNVIDIIESDGFKASAVIYTIVEGETPTTMAKSTGLSIMELATIFNNLKPDIVLTIADRFETIATAIAASYMNIPLAHTQGGEVTGSIDESVRHAVTKLSHIHFPATSLAAKNIIRMGEDAESVHLTGCPSIDIIARTNLSDIPEIFYQDKGVGKNIDPKKPYLTVLQHPVTTEYGDGLSQITKTMQAVCKLNMQTVWLWPNVDAGSDDISKGLRQARENNFDLPARFYRNFPVEDYAKLINNTKCLIGNSSSALREGSFLGTPAVNIGTRQFGREHGENILHVDYDAKEIEMAIHKQLGNGKYQKNLMFGDGAAGKKIANILASAKIKIQKTLSY